MTLLVGVSTTYSASSEVLGGGLANKAIYNTNGFVASASGNAVNAYVLAKSATFEVKVVVYDAAGNLLATSAAMDLAAGWNFAAISLAVTSGETYYLGLISTSNYYELWHSGSTWAVAVDTSGSYAAPQATIAVPGSGTINCGRWGIYLDGTTGGISNVDTDNTITRTQTNVVINEAGLTEAGATVFIETDDLVYSDAQTDLTTGASTIQMDTLSIVESPLTTASYQLQVRVECDEGSFSQAITLNPGTGKSVVEVDATPVVVLVDGYVTSIFYGYTGTAPAIGDQIEYDTLDSEGNAVTMENISGAVNGEFSIAGSETPTTFEVRWWNQTDFWSAAVMVTVVDSVIIQVQTGTSVIGRNLSRRRQLLLY